MNEVEKLYELVEPNRDCNLYKNYRECPIKHTQCEDCENFVYPPFTAEKQIGLIKWLMNNPKDFFSWTIQQQDKDIKYAFYVGYEYGGGRFLEFTEALAYILNDLWQDLTEEERKQIKEILE